MPWISDEFDKVVQASKGLATMISFSKYFSGGPGRFGPKEDCKKSMGFSSVWLVIDNSLRWLLKTCSESELPPKIFSQVNPPSLDFHNPLPIASPPVYISPVPA